MVAFPVTYHVPMSKYRKTLESDADVFVCGASDDLMDVYVNGHLVEEFDIDYTASRGSVVFVTPDHDIVTVTVHFDGWGYWTAEVVAKNGDADDFNPILKDCPDAPEGAEDKGLSLRLPKGTKFDVVS